MLFLNDLDVRNKKVLMRVDFNVPMNQEGVIQDLTRLKAALPSILYILEHGGCVILMSHLGRPTATSRPSLAPCAEALSTLLHRPVQMAADCVGEDVASQARALKPGEVLLLENLRFYPAEENPALDPLFAKQLASLADCYVNDAFGAAHRKHSSTYTVVSYFPQKAAAGFLMHKEIETLASLLSHPKRPFYALIGGAKISSKLGVLKALVAKTDALFVGGAMAFTLFKAQGIEVGDSLYEQDQLPAARELLKLAPHLYLPSDVVIADAFTNDAATRTLSISQGIPPGWRGMDIGPETCRLWDQKLRAAHTLFWNGPFGVFEFPRFAQGTKSIALTLASLHATTVVGGGDSVAALNSWGLSSHFTYLSTGGGASLEYLEQGHLPGIDVLAK